ncbi:uncharacterized protein LOC111709370 [Eurytemora carolleeae]|uniref:uncharacterized protein LOC111709370 n=1 Tax=Eurytemora carolleeae TaxID=1294199 RepID=UPI000C77C032|nr:uncharacterized protein LOC111709370 [Eurytemora carolleeae]|eukprot:XP_023338793.1 uncharacterized protein LOC111709370 [Eurytemora affinis]
MDGKQFKINFRKRNYEAEDGDIILWSLNYPKWWYKRGSSYPSSSSDEEVCPDVARFSSGYDPNCVAGRKKREASLNSTTAESGRATVNVTTVADTSIATEAAAGVTSESATNVITESATSVTTESATSVTTESATSVTTESATSVTTESINNAQMANYDIM